MGILHPNSIELYATLDQIGEFFIKYQSSILIFKIILVITIFLFYLSHILTGVLLIKVKSQGRYLMIIISWLYLFSVFFQFSVNGLVGHNYYYYLSIIPFFVIIVLLNNKKIQIAMPCRRSLKIVSITLCCFFLTFVSVYSYYIIKINRDSPGFKKTDFTKNLFADDEEIVTFHFPPYYSIDLPINKINLGMVLYDSIIPSISFINPKDSLFIFVYHNSRNHKFYEDFVVDKSRSEIEFITKFIKEKYGLKYLYWNGKLVKMFKDSKDYENFKYNNMDFIRNFIGSNFVEYSFYNNNELGAITFSKSNKNPYNPLSNHNNQIFINNIISSIKPINNIALSADEYFQRGLEYYNNGKYKCAILEFSSSLFLDSNNTKCELFLIKAKIESNNFIYNEEFRKWESAEYHLSKILERNPDIEEAKKLYQVSRDKEYKRKIIFLTEDVLRDSGSRSLFSRAEFYEEYNKLTSAISDYFAITELDNIKSKKKAKAYTKIAKIYINQNNLDQADLLLNKGFDADSTYKSIYFYKGEIFDKKDKYIKAVNMWAKAYKKGYRDNGIALKLALFFLKIKQIEPAKKIMRLEFKEHIVSDNNYSSIINKFNYPKNDETLLLELLNELIENEQIQSFNFIDAYKSIKDIDFSKFNDIQDINDYFE